MLGTSSIGTRGSELAGAKKLPYKDSQNSVHKLCLEDRRTKNVFDGLTVMISACHDTTKRGRSGFDSPSESKIYAFMSLSLAQTPDSFFARYHICSFNTIDPPKKVNFLCPLKPTMIPRILCYDIMIVVKL